MKRLSGPTLLDQFESQAPPAAAEPLSSWPGVHSAGRAAGVVVSISPPERRLLRTESSEKKARKWADAFTYARTLIGLPPLEAAQAEDGEWGIWNPDVLAPWLPPRAS